MCRDILPKQDPYSEKKAKCNYCGDLIKYLVGTSGMRNHLIRCKENPNREAFKRKKMSSSTTEGASVGLSPTISKFDQNASRMKLVKMFVKSELPFDLWKMKTSVTLYDPCSHGLRSHPALH